MSTQIDMTEDNEVQPAPLLGPAVIRQLFWRSFLLQAAFNFERFQNLGWWWGLKRLPLPSGLKCFCNSCPLPSKTFIALGIWSFSACR